MKRNSFIVLIIVILLALSLVSCNSGKSAKTRQEVKQLAETFYQDILNADNYKMTSSYNGVVSNVFTKDQDKMHVEIVDPEIGYDYYLFIKDGIKYLIADDGTLFEDESMYDLSKDTLLNSLKMGVLGYLDAEDESLNYSAVLKDDNNLNVVISGKNEGQDFTITSTGKKEDNKLTYIMNEIKYGEETYTTEYQFSYNEHVDLPEYKVPKSYNNLPHVDSPYQTYGQIIDRLSQDETLFYSLNEDTLFVIDEVDGRHYQFSSKASEDLINSYEQLDFFAEDYEKQVQKLIYDVTIEDCIDFTDELIDKDELDSYIGNTISDLIMNDFEITGYSFFDDHSIVYAQKDMMTYRVEVEPLDGFDPESEFEYDAFNDFIIKSIAFENPEYAILPFK